MFTEWVWLVWIVLVAGVIGIVYVYLTWNNDYWKRKNFPYVKPDLFFGNYTDVFLGRTTVGEVMEELYKKFDGKPFVGFWKFRTPCLLIRDLEAAKAVLLKDFNSFQENGFYVNPHCDPLIEKNPFFRSGDEWKNTRQLLTPSFTNARLKPLLSIMEVVAADFVKYLRTEATCCKDGVEAKDICSKYIMENVASCAFGITGESFSNPNAKLRAMTMNVLCPGFLKNLEHLIINNLPSLGKLLKLRMMPKEVDKFYRNIIQEVVEDREKRNVTRSDYLQSLIHIKKKAAENGERFTEEDITGHAVTFLTEGFETSSITLSFVLYHLAMDAALQEQLRQEVAAARRDAGGALSFEALTELPFMQQVIEETLRLHPPLMAMEKVCSQATVLRAADGSECAVERGQLVVLPVRGVHLDPRVFPDPQHFDPGRFSRARRASLARCAYLPFGEGPRMCLGMRFAFMQIKLALASIVENFNIKKTPRTPNRVEQDPTYFLACAKGGLWIGLEERKDDDK